MPSSRIPSVALWLLLAAVGLMVLPDEMQARCRLVVGEALSPGCLAWRSVDQRLQTVRSNWRTTPSDSTADLEQLHQALQSERARGRRLEIQLARTNEELQAQRVPLFRSSGDAKTNRLAQPVLVDAAVLGAGHTADWRRGRWLHEGKAAGLLEDALILTSDQPLLDQGQDADLSPEDRLLLGRCVIGKVTHVGRWTSTFQLVTDQGFLGRAQLVRETQEGYAFGAKGVMRGQGTDSCRLDGISAEESVTVGDLVYTADRDGLLPTPLYYGEVVEASLPKLAKEWQVLVRPAPRPADLTNVQVLRSALNRNRVLAN